MSRRSWTALPLLAALMIPGVALAQQRVELKPGEGKLGAARKVELKAKVDAIDVAARKVTLRLDDGTVETLAVSPEVKNLDKVKAGDTITATYYDSLTLSLNKIEGATPSLSEKVTDQHAESGQLPGGSRTKEITVVAKITAIDAAKSLVTLTGPKGASVHLEVAPDVLAKIKVGDLVNAVYTQALAVSVDVTPK
jgi:hypothetical protein